MAAHLQVLLVHHVETRRYDLGVSDALGVGTLYDVLHMLGDFGAELLHHLEIFDIDNGNKRCHKGYLVDFVLSEMLVLDFDDALFAEFATVEVVADEHLVFVVFQSKYAEGLVDSVGGDMVNHCSVLDGRDHHLFLVFHR